MSQRIVRKNIFRTSKVINAVFLKKIMIAIILKWVLQLEKSETQRKTIRKCKLQVTMPINNEASVSDANPFRANSESNGISD